MLNESQVAVSKVRLDKAREMIQDAQRALAANSPDTANNRAYYGMFHTIRAVLALEDVDFKSHSKLLGYFNKNYIHTGTFDRSFARLIGKVRDARTDSDYLDYFVASPEDAAANIEAAKSFYKVVVPYITKRIKTEYIPCDQQDDELEDEDEFEQ